jgi:hypothetical protein
LDALLACQRALCQHFTGTDVAPEFEPVGTLWWDDMLMAALSGPTDSDLEDASGGG